MQSQPNTLHPDFLWATLKRYLHM